MQGGNSYGATVQAPMLLDELKVEVQAGLKHRFGEKDAAVDAHVHHGADVFRTAFAQLGMTAMAAAVERWAQGYDLLDAEEDDCPARVCAEAVHLVEEAATHVGELVDIARSVALAAGIGG